MALIGMWPDWTSFIVMGGNYWVLFDVGTDHVYRKENMDS